MTIKILCSCGSKFAFDIDPPANGRMPVPVHCPSCGVNQTDAANEIIASQAGGPPVAPVAIAVAQVVSAAPVAQRVSVAPAIPSVPASPAVDPATAYAPPPIELCVKHPQSPAAANCVVCHKPICLDCMAQFGHLCSVYCKDQAQKKNIPVPFYAGLKTTAVQQQDNKIKKIAVIAGAALAVFVALLSFYNFYLAKPKVAFQLKSPQTARYVHAEWVGADKFVSVSTDKLALHDASSGKVLWESPFKADEKPEKPKVTLRRDEDDEFAYLNYADIKARLVGNELWVFFSKRAVRFDTGSGKRKQEVPLSEQVNDTLLGENTFVAIAEPNYVTKQLIRLDLASGKLQTLNLTQTVARPLPVRTAALNADDDFEPVFLGSSREIFLSGSSAIQLQSRLLEKRVAVNQARAQSQGPSLLDSSELRASQGIEVAEEFINQGNTGTSYEDQSRYAVTLKRLIGPGSSWNGEIVGAPSFFPMRTVDVLVGGKNIIAFSKNGQKLWQSKLNYPVANYYDDDSLPGLEHNNRLYFWDQATLTAFDLKKGEALWRLQSVGISQVNVDSRGKLYVSTTTATPDQIRPGAKISITDKIHPVILKVDPANGGIIWERDRIAERTYLVGKYLYGDRAQVSKWDVFSSISNNDDKDAPVHHRIYRIDPDNGKELWEYYRAKAPLRIDPKGNRLLLQYKNEIQMLKFFSL